VLLTYADVVIGSGNCVTGSNERRPRQLVTSVVCRRPYRMHGFILLRRPTLSSVYTSGESFFQPSLATLESA